MKDAILGSAGHAGWKAGHGDAQTVLLDVDAVDVVQLSSGSESGSESDAAPPPRIGTSRRRWGRGTVPPLGAGYGSAVDARVVAAALALFGGRRAGLTAS